MTDRIPRSRSSKSVRLQKWNEENEDFLDQLDKEDLFEEEIQTFRVNEKPRSRPTLSPGIFMQYMDKEDDGFDDVDTERLNMDNLRINQAKHKFLPATTLSPIRRKSLSDYSEDTETDITEMNDDFQDVDDIFGKEESGIYSSGDNATFKPDCSRASQILAKKKQQLQQAADLEDQELYQRYRRQHGDEVNTLKLKDLRFQQEANLDKDALENERTVNYEYTRDDYESFEDGFDVDPGRIEANKLRQFKSSGINHKMSMPVFPNLLKLLKQSKFRSTMDLETALRNEHPIFNNNNKLISKLDRMPSFHNRHEMDHLQNDELYNMEKKKKALLEKYMEITEKQKQLKTSPHRKRHPTKHGVGLVRYLNDRSAVPAVGGNGTMKFNARNKRWEGNDYELLRFEEDARKQPSLITRKDFDLRPETIKSNMKYDADNLRWVNMDEAEEVENNVFLDVPDLEPNDIPRYRIPKGDRGVSNFTQRTLLSVSSDHSSLSASAGDEFDLTPKLLAKFQKEEIKIRKKTHNWFGANEMYRVDKAKTMNTEYCWEIRKMVMDNDGGSA